MREHCRTLETNLGEDTLEWLSPLKGFQQSISTNRKGILMDKSEKKTQQFIKKQNARKASGKKVNKC